MEVTGQADLQGSGARRQGGGEGKKRELRH